MGNDVKIKLIEKDTDISSLKMTKINWDVIMFRQDRRPFQVVCIEDYYHSIGGEHGNNNLWMYPLDEEPSYENLIRYNLNGCGVSWGYKYEPYNYATSKYGKYEAITTGGVMITRNGKDFYHCKRGIHQALDIINHIDEHPLDLNFRGFEKDMIGRKVWWRSEPGIITRWIDGGRACVIIEPDGIEKFTTPAEFAEEEGDMYYEDNEVKTEIFDKHIWWHRD